MTGKCDFSSTSDACTDVGSKDSDCKNSCDPSGCNLNINKCSYGKCVYSGTSKFCGIGNSCDKAVECYASAGACSGG